MRRALSTLAVALFLAGCGVQDPRVAILTDEVSCFAGGETGSTGPLIADVEHGTTFMGQPVMWPEGYTARRAGTEVVVLDAKGTVRAMTGRTYHISHAWARSLGLGDVSAFVAAVDCGYPWDFIDCTAKPTDEYCKPQ